KSQKYWTAVRHYRRLQLSQKFLGESLNARDTLTLARCYHCAGKQRIALRLYKELLSLAEVQSDPRTLSFVYARLATAHGISTKQHKHLLELALQCLPDDSSYIACYAAVCSRFLRLGELTRARDVLSKMESYTIIDKEGLAILDVTQAILLDQYGAFARAA